MLSAAWLLCFADMDCAKEEKSWRVMQKGTRQKDVLQNRVIFTGLRQKVSKFSNVSNAVLVAAKTEGCVALSCALYIYTVNFIIFLGIQST